jgi:glucose-6-phosphate isomerase
VDGADLEWVLSGCRPESTLFIVASKTFTTQETLLNAIAARGWLTEALGADAVGAHFAAVTAHPDRAADFGIAGRRVFSFWDWVGGRYSVWSAIGLTAMIALGRDRFGEFLDGAREIDLHFRDAPLESNLPVRMALVGVWNRNFEGATTNAVLPYAEPLALLPAYLQQLEMESLGKRVDRDGRVVDYSTAPVVWGMTGTNGQHAFHQWLHQGTDPVAVDFIGFADRGRVLNANLLAQAQALADGCEKGDPLRDCPGRRPSTILAFDTLDARNLGRLLALYEHKVFVQSVIWNLNPFDQWGVELGKRLAQPLIECGVELI